MSLQGTHPKIYILNNNQLLTRIMSAITPTTSTATQKQYPRILVGTPTTDAKEYALARYLYAIKHIDYPNYDIVLVDNSKTPEFAQLMANHGVTVVRSPYMENPRDQLIAARNMLRKIAIDGGYDYFLSLESDVIAPPDIIQQLLQHNKEYVTIVMDNYILRADKVEKMRVVRRAFPDLPNKYYDLTDEEVNEGPLITIDRSHLGCTLISTNLLKQVEFRHDEWQYDDYLLCDDLRKLGVTLFCDTKAQIFHMCDGGSTHKRANLYMKQKELEQRQLQK